MVLIHSRTIDETTVEVIRWLVFYKKSFFRLNTFQDLLDWSFNTEFSFDDGASNNKMPVSFYFNGKSNFAPPVNKEDLFFSDQVTTYLQEQADALLEYALSSYAPECSFGLSPFSGLKVNKLKVLQVAKKIGFVIPPTAVVSSKNQLYKLKQKWGRIINKSLSSGIDINTDKVLINGQRTEEIAGDAIERMADFFFPSLIQQLIEKEFEVRVFFFRNRFYSIAIFTQRSSISKIDSRSIDVQIPNRQVPFTLPEEIQRKITLLMEQLELNYGSL